MLFIVSIEVEPNNIRTLRVRFNKGTNQATITVPKDIVISEKIIKGNTVVIAFIKKSGDC